MKSLALEKMQLFASFSTTQQDLAFSLSKGERMALVSLLPNLVANLVYINILGTTFLAELLLC